jgi:hypothetical protein
MARKMKKFSAGGAQGRYDRRMADIEKDRKIALAKGKNADVAEAKAAQRIADAKDDLAKRTGADRTATRAAERLAESNLTKTRKYGAPQSVTKDTAGPTGKVTDTLGTITAPKSELASKPSSFKEAFKEARSRLGAGKTFTFGGKSYTTNIAGEGRKPVQKPAQKAAPTPEKKAAPEKAVAPSKFDSKAFADLKAKMPKPTVTTTGGTALRGKPGGTPLIRFGRDVANDPARKVKLAEMKRAAEAPGATQFAKDRYKSAVSSDMYAKGGKVNKKETTMKYRSGGSTPPKPPQPTAAERAADAKFRKSVKNLKVTPEQAAAIGRANRSSGYAKGGKAKAKPFAATKFGAAMVKKSADTKGRAMVKKAGGGKCYASGGLIAGHKSADGIATKGKTKGKTATMARGGSAKMRGRDSYGGAMFKKGGSC